MASTRQNGGNKISGRFKRIPAWFARESGTSISTRREKSRNAFPITDDKGVYMKVLIHKLPLFCGMVITVVLLMDASHVCHAQAAKQSQSEVRRGGAATVPCMVKKTVEGRQYWYDARTNRWFQVDGSPAKPPFAASAAQGRDSAGANPPLGQSPFQGGSGVLAPTAPAPGDSFGRVERKIPDAAAPDATGKMRTNIVEVYVGGVLAERTYDMSWPDGTSAGKMQETDLKDGMMSQVYTDPEGKVIPHGGRLPAADLRGNPLSTAEVTAGSEDGAGSSGARVTADVAAGPAAGQTGAPAGVASGAAPVPAGAGMRTTAPKTVDLGGGLVHQVKETWDGNTLVKVEKTVSENGVYLGTLVQTGFVNNDPTMPQGETYTDRDGKVMPHAYTYGEQAAETATAASMPKETVSSGKSTRSPDRKRQKKSLHGPRYSEEAKQQRESDRQARETIRRQKSVDTGRGTHGGHYSGSSEQPIVTPSKGGAQQPLPSASSQPVQTQPQPPPSHQPPPQ
jgi:hypothetical protein